MEVVPDSSLEFSTRAMHILQRMQIHTIEEFVNIPIDKLFEQKGIGKKTIDEISNIQAKIINGEFSMSQIQELFKDNYGFAEKSLCFSQDVLKQMARHSISELNLSVRSDSSLKREKIFTIDQIMLLTSEDLRKLPRLGEKSISEIKTARQRWIDNNKLLVWDDSRNIDISESRKKIYINLAKEIKKIILLKWETLFRLCEENGVCNQIETKNINYLCLFEKVVEIRKGLADYFKGCLSDGDTYIKEKVLFDKIESDFTNESMKEAIYNIFNYGGVLLKSGEFFMLRRQSLSDFILSLEDTDKNQMLIGKFNGMTLQGIGEQFGVSRERIRQNIVKVMKTIPLLNEDYYASIYTYFRFDKALFYEVFQRADYRAYEYLSIRYKRGEHQLIREEVEQYDGPFVSVLFTYLDKNDVIKWKRSLTRRKLAWRVLISLPGEYIGKENFEKAYYEFVEKNNIDKKRFSYNQHTILNSFRNSNHVVFNREGEFRYYENNVSTLWSQIDFRRYNNSVISAELIYYDYSEMMEELDIRNGYELFCLLKNVEEINCHNNCPSVVFRRIPIMIIGDGDESKQVMKLLREMAPVEYWDFFEAYEQRYGVRKMSAAANLRNYIEPYYSNGKYIIDLPELDAVDEAKFQRVLFEKDFWSMAELENAFENVCVNSEVDALNGITLYKLGFSLNAGYAYNRKYGNVIDCINSTFFNKDLVDLNEVDIEVARLSIFKSSIIRLREKLDYIEISPKLLASRRFLEREYGLTEPLLKEIQEEVSVYCNDKYFNGNSLWTRIKDISSVQKLNNNKWLCTSILRQQKGIFSLSIVNAVVLSLYRDELSLAKICEWIIDKEGKMNLGRLTERVNELFGSKIDKYKIAFKLKEQGVIENLLTDNIDDYIEQLISSVDDGEDDLFKEEFF